MLDKCFTTELHLKPFHQLFVLVIITIILWNWGLNPGFSLSYKPSQFFISTKVLLSCYTYSGRAQNLQSSGLSVPECRDYRWRPLSPEKSCFPGKLPSDTSVTDVCMNHVMWQGSLRHEDKEPRDKEERCFLGAYQPWHCSLCHNASSLLLDRVQRGPLCPHPSRSEAASPRLDLQAAAA